MVKKVVLIILIINIVGLIKCSDTDNKIYKALKTVEMEFIVSASCYFPDKRQTDNTPHKTANNSNINKKYPLKHRWVAISRDLKEFYSFGDTLVVSGTWVYDGLWIVQDVMNKRFKRKIDFLIGSYDYGDNFNNVIIKKK